MLKLAYGIPDCYDWRGTALVKVTAALPLPEGDNSGCRSSAGLQRYIEAMASITAVTEVLDGDVVVGLGSDPGTSPEAVAKVVERLSAVLPREMARVSDPEPHDVTDVAVRGIVAVAELYRRGLRPIGFRVDHLSFSGGYAGQVPIVCLDSRNEIVHIYIVPGHGLDVELLGRRASLLGAAENIVSLRGQLIDAPMVRRAAALVLSATDDAPDAWITPLGDLETHFPWALAYVRYFQDKAGLRDAGRGVALAPPSRDAIERPVAWLKLGVKDEGGQMRKLDSFRVTSRQRSIIESLHHHLGGRVVEAGRGTELWDAGSSLPVVVYPGSVRFLWEHLVSDKMVYCENGVLLHSGGELCPHVHEPAKRHKLITDLTVRLAGAEHLGCLSLRSTGAIAHDELATTAASLLKEGGGRAYARLWIDHRSSGGKNYVVPTLTASREPGVFYTWPLKAGVDDETVKAIAAVYGVRHAAVVVPPVAVERDEPDEDASYLEEPEAEIEPEMDGDGPESSAPEVISTPDALGADAEPPGVAARSARLYQELSLFVHTITPGQIADLAQEVLAGVSETSNPDEIIEAAGEVMHLCLVGVGFDLVDAALPWRDLLNKHGLDAGSAADSKDEAAPLVADAEPAAPSAESAEADAEPDGTPLDLLLGSLGAGGQNAARSFSMFFDAVPKDVQEAILREIPPVESDEAANLASVVALARRLKIILLEHAGQKASPEAVARPWRAIVESCSSTNRRKISTTTDGERLAS